MSATYQELLDHNPKIGRILSRERYDFAVASNDRTVSTLRPQWDRQLRKNIKKFYDKHGMLIENCWGFGSNKAVIGIGAGPSFNRNKELVRKLCRYNAQFPFENQPFVFIASNHQFKPCLEMGIIPHFVILVDASESDALMSQLCRNIPKRGQNVTLICSLHASPRILKEWDRQERLIQFYMPIGEENRLAFKDVTGKEYNPKHQVMQGGNVLNVAWTCSTLALDSRVFIAVGNDLSYDISKDEDQRRKNYYADGDYSSNLASRRDEASRQFRWMGFDIRDSIITGEPHLDFKPKGTVQSLYSYKTWLETQVAIQDTSPASWHYYNCSETGILGIIAKSEDKADLDTKSVRENWLLMDEILPNRWHTQKLETAATRFLAAREQCRTQMETVISAGIQAATGLPPRMDGANITGPSGLLS